MQKEVKLVQRAVTIIDGILEKQKQDKRYSLLERMYIHSSERFLRHVSGKD